MQGRVYTVSFENATLANASGDYDLFSAAPADDKPIALMGFTLDNVGGTADAGDAQEEFLRISVVRGNSTGGSGGSTPTPAPLRPNDTAASFTAHTMDTTPASTGGTTLLALGWNVRIPMREFWPEEVWPVCSQTENRICVRMLSTAADDIAVSGSLYVVEMT